MKRLKPIREVGPQVGCSADSLRKAVFRKELAGHIEGRSLCVSLAAARQWWNRDRKPSGRKAKA